MQTAGAKGYAWITVAARVGRWVGGWVGGSVLAPLQVIVIGTDGATDGGVGRRCLGGRGRLHPTENIHRDGWNVER